MTEHGDKYKRFDVADYLIDTDDIAGYLELAIEESIEDPSAVPRALGVIARTQNMSELARRVGMSRDGLYKALSDDGNPTWSTILKVTSALGLRFELHSAN
jgi:probable addiction module antidote protein